MAVHSWHAFTIGDTEIIKIWKKYPKNMFPKRHDIYRHIQMYTDVYRCIQMYTDVCRCIQMYAGVYRRMQMYTQQQNRL